MIYPKKLQPGDEVRVVAPARSLKVVSEETRKIANERLKDLGFRVTFGKHVEECDDFKSSSIESRIADLHDAFLDQNVKAVLAAIGGFNSNQLLNFIDWDIIKNNPKVFCGYSDITALNDAIFARTGLVNYSGPAFSSFGEKKYFDYSLDYFKKCILSEAAFDIFPSESWNDDSWYKDQKNRHLIKNKGWLSINEGEAEGIIIGGNLCTLNLLQGTPYFPDLEDSVLFLEDDEVGGELSVVELDRNLQSLLQVPSFTGVRGIVLGRFQVAAKMTDEKLTKIIKSKKELENIPVLANLDFGHTNPKITFPIGGRAFFVSSTESESTLKILGH